MKKMASKADFETFVELVNGNLWREPEYNSCKVRVTFDINGVEATLDLTALEVTKEGVFYGRRGFWNAVRLSSDTRSSIHYKGKGARDPQTWVEGNSLIEMLFA